MLHIRNRLYCEKQGIQRTNCTYLTTFYLPRTTLYGQVSAKGGLSNIFYAFDIAHLGIEHMTPCSKSSTTEYWGRSEYPEFTIGAGQSNPSPEFFHQVFPAIPTYKKCSVLLDI